MAYATDTKETKMTNPAHTPNPVIKTTALDAYPGWNVRQYLNGMYDGTNGQSLTIGCKTFSEVVKCIREVTGPASE